jgi:hypothetical protein
MIGLPGTTIDGMMVVGCMTKAKILMPCYHYRKRQGKEVGGNSGSDVPYPL